MSGWQPTEPGTQVSWTVEPRDRPCWRCRFHFRWPPATRCYGGGKFRVHWHWRVHWECREPPKLTYLDA